MEIEIEDFFKPINAGKSILKEDYNTRNIYAEVAEAFARATYQSIYIIDYVNKGFLYVSDNPLFLCGNSAEYVKNIGYAFYLKHVPKEDLQLLLEINIAGFQFYEKIPTEDRLKYTISYDFYIEHTKNKKLLINHKLTPLKLDQNGKIWLAVCVVSISSNHFSGNITIKKKNDDIIHEYDLGKKVWTKKENIKLSEREKEILYLSAQGYSNHDIAEKIFLADETIKFHKKNIFEKLEVRNITEAVSFAVNNNILL